jgi:hypothetical protein
MMARCQRGVDLIQRTDSREARQVMLGCFLRDLASAERLIPGASPAAT